MAIVINTNAYEEKHGSVPLPATEGRFTFTAEAEGWKFTGMGAYKDLEKAARRAFSLYFKTSFGRIELAV